MMIFPAMLNSREEWTRFCRRQSQCIQTADLDCVSNASRGAVIPLSDGRATKSNGNEFPCSELAAMVHYGFMSDRASAIFLNCAIKKRNDTISGAKRYGSS